MVDKAVLEGKFYNLVRYLTALRQAVNCPQQEFVQDHIRTGAARYYLLVAIECCLDVGNHIIASDGLRSPKDYRDIFTVLQENNIVHGDFLATLHQMVGLRNILVHDYETIDDQRIYVIATTESGDFDRFVRSILDYAGL